jgi:hypothetical protein
MSSLAPTFPNSPTGASDLHKLPAEIRLMILRCLFVGAPEYDIRLGPDSAMDDDEDSNASLYSLEIPSEGEREYDTEYESADDEDEDIIEDNESVDVAPADVVKKEISKKERPMKRAHRVSHTTLMGGPDGGCSCHPSQSHTSCLSAQILRTCHQFYSEGIGMLYGDNVFAFKDFTQLRRDFMERIGLANLIRVRSIRLYNPTSRGWRSPIWKYSPEVWRSLRNIQNVEFVFTWSFAISPFPESSWRFDLTYGNRWPSDRFVNEFCALCDNIQTDCKEVVSKLERVQDINFDTAESETMFHRTDEFLDEPFAGRVSFSVRPGIDMQQNPAVEDEAFERVMKIVDRGYNESFVQPDERMNLTVKEILEAYWFRIKYRNLERKICSN